MFKESIRFWLPNLNLPLVQISHGSVYYDLDRGKDFGLIQWGSAASGPMNLILAEFSGQGESDPCILAEVRSHTLTLLKRGRALSPVSFENSDLTFLVGPSSNR